jgi:5,10-methylene-tetrahydrofolate dehydrogenase/methenyl tetrahydrofolate cyclohydrolase
LIKREAEKILKYKDLITEIQRMWNVKAKVIPVVIGASGTISKPLRRYLNNIPGKHDIRELQKSHTERCTQTAESADVEVQNIQHGKQHYM